MPVREYAPLRGNPDNAPAKQDEYRAKLAAMNDTDLFKETKDKIWFSAFAANNPRSCYHWQCDDTYAEWGNRGKQDQYGVAHKQVMRENGY